MRSLLMLCYLFISQLCWSQQEIKTYYDETKRLINEAYHIVWKDTAILQGPYKKFDADGHLIIKGGYDDNLRAGTFINYYPNGTIQRTSNYEKGAKEGVTLVYNSDGVLIQEAVFRQDSLLGAVKLYQWTR
jgi:antitoxin component YwqK of YwqJK toxin-antitoxin module